MNSTNSTGFSASGNFSGIGLGVILTLVILFIFILALLCLRLAACCTHVCTYCQLIKRWGQHPR
ncbi:E3 CR1-alpha0 [Human mastadenovirus C]|uniref:E3 CR1-alpha0 n=1 Tax=Human mastadenovirus C TaxID=129951 RepID=A0A3S9SNF6_9ADEN|nr:E3 CR1-alpha0 [Human mastadenovirus C]